ncbi:MAG: amidohydrolase [Planctomycetota bacterium]
MRIDAHQHFWRYRAADYPWIDGSMQAIARDFLPEHLVPELAQANMDGCIAVQARHSEEETEFLLGLARASASAGGPQVRGVVGWTDLLADDVDEKLEALAADPKLVGLRHIVQDEADDQFLLHPDFQSGVQEAGERGLVYDILVVPRQLDAAVSFVASLSDQPFVLDHLAKPNIKEQRTDDWQLGFDGLGQFEHVACKLSGLVTEANWRHWQPADFTRYLDHALEAFGPERLLFGSDWPVCLLGAADYQEVYGLLSDWSSRLSDSEQQALFGGNAVRVYGLDRGDS